MTTMLAEVEIVYEAHVSEELRQAALELQLPPNFYSYLTAPPCSGCAGCDPNSEDEDVEPKPSTTSSKIKTSAVTPSSVASQPFPPAISTTESSAMPSQPLTFTVNTTSSLHSSSQPFSFAVKTTTVTSTTPPSSVFGFSTTKQSPVTTASTPLLPTPTAVQSGFGTQTAQSPFGGASITPGGQSTDSSNSGPAFLLKPTTTFSDIAVQEPAFGSDKANNNFSWADAGAPVFGVGKTKEEESGPEEAEGQTSQDPVLEPVVPLLNAIQVQDPDEEDEEKEFCHRAKFYRYDKDNKKWKEREVGDMKILRHPETNTYRLLLRREQVHKVVCNQLITGEMNMVPQAGSDNAFVWTAMNLAEEYSEPQLEQVAVMFKNADIAAEFRAKLDECIAVVKARNQAGAGC